MWPIINQADPYARNVIFEIINFIQFLLSVFSR